MTLHRKSRRTLLLAGALAVFATATAQAITMNTVAVGNAGNASDSSTGYGSVPYAYQIGEYDVTDAQYAAFLNAVAATDTYSLYLPYLATDAEGGITRSGSSGSYTYACKPGYASMPVVDASYYSAMRFCNWMTKGQPSGPEGAATTETGVYTFSGPTTVVAAPHSTLTGAAYFLPTQNEWYKAAYYNGATGSYYAYGTHFSSLPGAVAPTGAANAANYYGINGYALTQSTSYVENENYLSSVGAYGGSASPVGAWDMSGDVWQWTEDPAANGLIYVRGGSWASGPAYLASSSVFSMNSGGDLNVGFRVAGTAAVPEPAGISLLCAGGLCGLAFAWRRRRPTARRVVQSSDNAGHTKG